MIYPTGYTVMLPASVENTPGNDTNGVKDKEGTIQADKDTRQAGRRCRERRGGRRYSRHDRGSSRRRLQRRALRGLAGFAGGVAWALLKHGPEVKLEVGTSLEMEIQRPIPVDASRIQVARAGQ